MILRARAWGAASVALAAVVGAASAQGAPPQDKLPQERQRPDIGKGLAPTRPVNTLQELYDAFYACWKAPGRNEFRSGMSITIMFALNRDGNIQGEPRFTFASRDVPPDARATYQRSLAEALKTCSPFPLTSEFANSIAGRPQRLHFIDARGQKRTEYGRSRKHHEA